MAYDHGNRMFDGTPKTPPSSAAAAAAAAAVVITIVDDYRKNSLQQSQISETTSEIIQTAAMQSSEEVNQINSALTHCTQLRTQLRGTLLYIQRLNSKYAQTDYMAVVRNLDNYRRNQLSSSSSTSVSAAATPYPKVRSRQCSRSTDENNETGKNASNSNIIGSTPVKRTSKMTRRRLGGRHNDQHHQEEEEEKAGINNATFTSTPKRTKFDQLAAAFEFGGSDIDDNGTPKRTVREMANKSNSISVCKIKVQRNIEAIITHLQVMQKQQVKRRQQQLEQSLYQSCSSNLSSFGSPITSPISSSSAAASPRFATPQQHHQHHHLRYMEQSNASSYGTAYDSCNSMNSSSTKFYTPPQPSSSSSSSKFNRSSSMQFNEGKTNT